MPNGQSVVPSGGGAAGTKVFEAINWLKGLGGIGFAKAGQEIGKEKYKGRSALDAFLELVPGALESGEGALRDIAGRQTTGRVGGAVPGGIIGWLLGGPVGAAGGAYLGSRWGQQLGRRAKGGVSEATRKLKELGDVPKTMFETGGKAAGIKLDELLSELKGGVRAGREAVGGRATEDALTALLLAGGGKDIKDIAFGEGELGTLIEKPEGKTADYFRDLYHGGKVKNLGGGSIETTGGLKDIPANIIESLMGAGGDVAESVRGGKDSLLDLIHSQKGEAMKDVFQRTVTSPSVLGGPDVAPVAKKGIGDIFGAIRDYPSPMNPRQSWTSEIEDTLRWMPNLGGRQ